MKRLEVGRLTAAQRRAGQMALDAIRPGQLQARNVRALACWRARRNAGGLLLDAYSPLQRVWLDLRLEEQRVQARRFLFILRCRRETTTAFTRRQAE